MTPQQLESIEEAVGKAIKTHVNGKIDGLRKDFQEYVKDDTEWKVKAQPVIKMGENLQGFSKVTLYLLGLLAASIAAILAVKKLFL